MAEHDEHTYSVAGLSPLPFRNAPPQIAVRVVLGVRRALERITTALSPAFLAGFDATLGIATTAMLGAVARFGVADVLQDGPLSAADVAARCGANADAMHRTLRALATKGFFTLRKDGRFENNRLSRTLVSGHPGRAKEWCEYFSSASNAHAWIDFTETLRTGVTAFDRVHEMSVWEWFDAHPSERECFAQCMMASTMQSAPAVASLFPWKEAKVVCDVGGGRGTLLSELLVRHPHLEGVLCDGAGVVQSAKALLRARGVEHRVACKPGSFFHDVPKGADTYTLKNVLHDWGDEQCLTILRTVRAAMQPGHRVLIIEGLVEKNDLGIGAMMDVQMLVVATGGRERGRDEFRALLERTGFRMARVFPGQPVAVVEGIAT